MTRNLVLLGSLAIIGLLGFLTMRVAIEDGIDVLVVLSAIVLALLAIGVIGSLGERPPGDE